MPFREMRLNSSDVCRMGTRPFEMHEARKGSFTKEVSRKFTWAAVYLNSQHVSDPPRDPDRSWACNIKQRGNRFLFASYARVRPDSMEQKRSFL